jgi:hypothetical protein
MNFQKPVGIALCCGLEGIIKEVIQDDLNICKDVLSGTSISKIVDGGSKNKIGIFLSEVRRNEACFDWEINFQIKKKYKPCILRLL